MCAEKSRQGCAIEANHIKNIFACLSGTVLPGSIPGGSFSIFVLQPAPLFYSLYLSIAFIYFKFSSYLYHSMRISFSSLSFSSFLAVSLSADTDGLSDLTVQLHSCLIFCGDTSCSRKETEEICIEKIRFPQWHPLTPTVDRINPEVNLRLWISVGSNHFLPVSSRLCMRTSKSIRGMFVFK